MGALAGWGQRCPSGHFSQEALKVFGVVPSSPFLHAIAVSPLHACPKGQPLHAPSRR